RREPPVPPEPPRQEHPGRDEDEQRDHRPRRGQARDEPRAVALPRDPVPPLPPLRREAEREARHPRHDEREERELEAAHERPAPTSRGPQGKPQKRPQLRRAREQEVAPQQP